MKATEETKAKAKEAGVKSWWVKSEEKLQEELGGVAIDAVEPEPEVIEVVKEPDKVEPDLLKLMQLMEGCSFDRALMSIRMNGKKSKFFEFKEIIVEKANGN